MAVLLLSLLLQIIATSSQTQSITAQNYFIDVFKSINTPFNGNNPIGQAEYSPVPNYPYVAYPMNTCTRDGNDFATSGATTSAYTKWKCSQTGNMGSRCTYAVDDTCGGNKNCDPFTTGSANWDISDPDLIFGQGNCDCALGVNQCQNDKGANYMEIGYWKGYFDFNDGCPGIPLDTQTNLGYEYGGFVRLATGVCVKQDNNQYIMASCTMETGELALYSNSGCTNKLQDLISYTTTCEYYDNPKGGGQTFRYFRRLEGCYVNGNDIQVPTPSPTLKPTKAPSKTPTKSPTTPFPSKAPTTPIPSKTPTKTPSGAPTLPSASPSKAPTTPRPTKSPITPRPTRTYVDLPTRTGSPSRTPTPSPTEKSSIEQAQAIYEGLGTLEMAIIIGSVVLFIICCIVCCWYKKKQLKEIKDSHAKKRMNRRRQMQMMKRKQQQQSQQRHVVRQQSPRAGDGDTQPFTHTTV